MNENEYERLLSFLMPKWDSREIDVELRLAAILGMQGTGKTTLVQTIANDLAEQYGDDFICLKGYWLHKLIPEAREEGVLEGKKHVLIVLEDATTVLHTSQSRILLARDMVYFWRLRHELKEAGVKQYTTKVVLVINMHSYMTITKYLRNTHVLIVKSTAPKWQRFEHEDITLRWLDNAIVKELTRMRFSESLEDVLSALNKALVAYHTGQTSIIRYRAKKQWPKQFYENNEIGIDSSNREEANDNQQTQALFHLWNTISKHIKIQPWNKQKYKLVLQKTTFYIKKDLLDQLLAKDI